LARETGWSEDVLMYEIPFARLLKYYHAAIWANGAWTRKPVEKGKVISVDSLLSAVKQTPLDDDYAC
jgi:hypothetical protein